MVWLGFEPGATGNEGWKAPTNPLSVKLPIMELFKNSHLALYAMHFKLLDNVDGQAIQCFLKRAIPGLFLFIFVFSIQLTLNIMCKFLLMTEVEPRTSGIGSNRFTNWATTTSRNTMLLLWFQILLVVAYIRLKQFILQVVQIWRGRDAAIAQWIRLRLPSCRPGFESQAHHLCFHQFIKKCVLWKRWK